MDSGFFIVNRDVFQHHLFDREPYCRGYAWLWLIAMAAWKPTERRTKRGQLLLDRGQLTINERELAGIFNWSKSTVRRFLMTLVAERMIEIATRGPESGPENGPRLTHEVTLLTIRNYDSFQNRRQPSPQRADHKVDHRPDQETQLPLLPQEPAAPNHTNQRNHIKGRDSQILGVGKVGDTAPPDGQQKPAKGIVFARVGSDYWRDYAEDYRAVTGAEPLPKTYPDGVRGRWFVLAGEATNRRRA